MRAILPALLLLVPALASGCVGEALATAMEARHPADAAARLWNDDARLAGVLGIEGTGPLATWAVSFVTQQDLPARGATTDEEVGDGRAEAWIYKYVAAGVDEAYVVVIDQEGNVRSAKVEPRGAGDVALGEWRVDSDEALGIAMRENQGFREGVAREDYGLAAALTTEDGIPVWHILGGGRSAGGAGGGYVKLEAASGNVLANAGGFS